jgi:hypothetical protein
MYGSTFLYLVTVTVAANRSRYCPARLKRAFIPTRILFKWSIWIEGENELEVAIPNNRTLSELPRTIT